MRFKLNKISTSILAVPLATVMLSGCSFMSEHKAVNKEVITPLEMIDKISKNIKTTSKKEGMNSSYFSYKVASEDKDLVGLDSIKKDLSVDFTTNIGDALDYLSRELKVNIVYNIENPLALKTDINLSLKNSDVSSLVKILERTGNLDIYFTNGTLVVSDLIVLQGSLSKVNLNQGTDTNEGKDETIQNLTKHLKSILVSKNTYTTFDFTPVKSESSSNELISDELDSDSGLKDDGIKYNSYNTIVTTNEKTFTYQPSVVIDELTGTFQIKARPETIRRSAKFIEDVINRSLSYANVELSIYQVDNTKAKNIGVSVNKLIDNLYSLSAGSTEQLQKATLSLSKLSGVGEKDALTAGLSLYEKTGLIKTESKTELTVFNGIKTSLSDIQDVGFWTPGNISENTTVVNGASVTTFSEEKPEFTPEEVGKKLDFTPKIDLNNRTINMQVAYSVSSIYTKETFSWTRNTNLGDTVEIKKPLRTENRISAVLLLNEGKNTIMAGMKSKKGSIEREGLPGVSETPLLQDVGSNSTESTMTDTVMVLTPKFPTERIEEVIKRVKINLDNY